MQAIGQERDKDMRLDAWFALNGRFVKGKSGGRKPGTRNKRSLAIAEEIRKRKVDPLIYLSDLLADEATEKPLRVTCASTLLPYLHPRLKEQPARRVVSPVLISPPRSASEAADAISMIAAKAAAGGIDLNDAADLTKLLESYVRAYASSDLEALVAKVRAEVWSDIHNGAVRPTVIEGSPN